MTDPRSYSEAERIVIELATTDPMDYLEDGTVACHFCDGKFEKYNDDAHEESCVSERASLWNMRQARAAVDVSDRPPTDPTNVWQLAYVAAFDGVGLSVTTSTAVANEVQRAWPAGPSEAQ
jgi:hypothetical protein